MRKVIKGSDIQAVLTLLSETPTQIVDIMRGYGDTYRAFAQQRETFIETLRELDADDWTRGATFTATTSEREATVLSYTMRIADHEVLHLKQLQRTVSG